MYQNEVVLCSASHYIQKYYFNDDFNNLPKDVKDELQIMCVLFTEDIGGILTVFFDEEGNLQLSTEADEDDILYDEIGSGLKIRQLQREKKELFEQLEKYYSVFFLGNELE